MRRTVFLAIAIVALSAAYAAAQERFDDVIAQGRLALDTGRPQEAMALFEHAAALEPDRAEEIAPDRSWAFMRLGNDAITAAEPNPERANEYFTAAAAAYPDFAKVFMEQWVFVRTRAVNRAVERDAKDPERGDWQTLADDVAWVIEHGGDNSQARYLRGVIYEFQGKETLAKEQYRLAMKGAEPANESMDALRDAAAKAGSNVGYVLSLRPTYPPWQKSDAGKFQELRSGPFTIYHHNKALAERVGAVLQYYLDQPVLDGFLTPGGPFPKECKVYIYPTKRTFKTSGSTESWAAGTSKFTFVDGKLQTPSIQLYQTSLELTEGPVPHELAHVRFLAKVGSYEKLNLWLQEGIATSAESEYSRRMKARELVKAQKEDKLIPVADIMTATSYPQGDASDIFYAESLAVVQVLVSDYGKDAFWEFVRESRNSDGPRALKAVYNVEPINVEDLVLGWIDENGQRRKGSQTRTGSPQDGEEDTGGRP